jgi:hypothetical protein
MGTLETVALVVVAALATPFLLYLSAKLVTYGILAGRARFYRDNPQPPVE